MKTAIIFGVTGQDGSYLSEYLLDLDYYVLGVKRRSSVDNTWRIKHLLNKELFYLVEGDLTDYASVEHVITKAYYGDKWDFGDDESIEIYNLAAQSHVGTSFTQPRFTCDVNYYGLLNLLECIREKVPPRFKIYQASSSEMFGNNVDSDGFQRETTPFNPQSPYAISKVVAHHLAALYRDAYGMFVSCGVLFNHESSRRGEEFVTRKITKYAAELLHFKNTREGAFSSDYPKLKLGNLYSARDWGFAGDYVKAMHLMLQKEQPKDYVIATGKSHTVEEFLQQTFDYIKQDFDNYLEIDQNLIRPAEVNMLKGDASLAMKELGWKPECSLNKLVKNMVDGEPSLKKFEILPALEKVTFHPDNSARMNMLSKLDAATT